VLNPQRLTQRAAQIFSLFRRDEFHVKKQRHYFAKLHFKRKLPGAFGEATKNAPAIANVRVQEV
jgi:hypothetical protein